MTPSSDNLTSKPIFLEDYFPPKAKYSIEIELKKAINN